MSIAKVREYFGAYGMEGRIMEFATSSATVELAAETLGVIPARIAKTLSFRVGDGCVLILAAGDAKIDNHKYKAQFGTKAKMLTPDEAVACTGHAVGGVCPFGVPEDVAVYLDVSLQRFNTVFPAAGSAASAIELTCDELFRYSHARAWIDVGKDWIPGDDPRVSTEFLDTSDLTDGEIRLVCREQSPADEKKGFVPAYHFDIVRASDGQKVGVCMLRLGYSRGLYYAGHIGYTVDEPFRGNRYAEKASRLLLPLAKKHGMPYLYITCDAENAPSRRTLERLGGVFEGAVAVPEDLELYREGHGVERIFRYDL